MNAKRDWGFAGDYVEAMWLMLQQDIPQDFVIATGETHTVREFVELSFKEVGIDIVWKGSGIEEKGFDKKTNKVLVDINPRYFRPTEVDLLQGDPTKAEEELKWKRKVSFQQLIHAMVESDLKEIADLNLENCKEASYFNK